MLHSTVMPSLSLSPAGPSPFIPPAHARSLSSSSSRSGTGSSGGQEQEQAQAQGQERDIRQPSMDVEKDVATALRGVQEMHRAGKYQEVRRREREFMCVRKCIYKCSCVACAPVGRCVDWR